MRPVLPILLCPVVWVRKEKLVLQVELDETGRIDKAKIVQNGGYSRLDNAALSAVKTWRCRPGSAQWPPCTGEICPATFNLLSKELIDGKSAWFL
ncbi:MAG: TonB family protein [Nitrosomonas sp.]|nr:TonB family protein [Nitrosomonas sp.]